MNNVARWMMNYSYVDKQVKESESDIDPDELSEEDHKLSQYWEGFENVFNPY